MAEKKVYSGKEGEEAGRKFQEQLKKQANELVSSGKFVPRSACNDHSRVK